MDGAVQTWPYVRCKLLIIFISIMTRQVTEGKADLYMQEDTPVFYNET